MSKKKEQFPGMNKGEGSNTSLLRIGVIFLSVVSFYTTANGMRDYIFQNNGAVAYAASAAIQGILLALSMNLPRYLQNIFRDEQTAESSKQLKLSEEAKENHEKVKTFNENAKAFARKAVRFLCHLISAACALLLTVVIIFCSSWFSYIYIADTLYKDSWDSDSELLVQQTYRTELYNASDYAHSYGIYLEESVGEKILQLEQQAYELAGNGVDSAIEWAAERDSYVTGKEGIAGSYMSMVIDAMEAALGKDANQNQRDIAARALEETRTNIAARLEEIQQNLDTINDNISSYNAQITDLGNQINRSPEGTDTTALYNAINSYTQLIEDAVERQGELQQEQLLLDSALSRIPYYEAALGLSSSTSNISIRRDLLQLQADFFKTDLDVDELLETATGIFENLRNAASTAQNSTADTTENMEEQEAGSENSLSYSNLLVQMNRLISDLRDYATVKDIEAELDRLIAELRNDVDAEGTESDEQADSALPIENNAEGMAVSANSVSDADETFRGAGDVSGNESNSQDEKSKGEAEDEWKDKWRNRIEHLKSQISAMPKYIREERTGSETVNALTELQLSVLTAYDRDGSSRALDNMVHRYVSDRSPVYKGIIYLQSSYRSLALFALSLAVSFDLAGFIFGFVEQGNTKQKEDRDDSESKKKEESNRANDREHMEDSNSEPGINEHWAMRPAFVQKKRKKQKVKKVSSTDDRSEPEWSVLATLTQYIILTGDYESRDGIYYYNAFKNGVLCNWVVRDTVPYIQGIYIQEAADKEYAKGMALPKERQELRFSGQEGGPQDGIYGDCQLLYDEGSLILRKDEQKTFLANIDEYVPVHSYKSSIGESRTIPSKQLKEKTLDDQSIVVALNEKGTRIAAIYIVEHL